MCMFIFYLNVNYHAFEAVISVAFIEEIKCLFEILILVVYAGTWLV
jgi:hypothetical protein